MYALKKLRIEFTVPVPEEEFVNLSYDNEKILNSQIPIHMSTWTKINRFICFSYFVVRECWCDQNLLINNDSEWLREPMLALRFKDMYSVTEEQRLTASAIVWQLLFV